MSRFTYFFYWILFFPNILWDAISGYFILTSSQLSFLSQLIKMILLLFFITISLKKRNFSLIIFNVFIFGFLSSYINVFINSEFKSIFTYQLPLLAKILFNILAFMAINQLYQKGYLKLSDISRCLTFSYWVVVVNVSLGLAGYGYNTYQHIEGGFKGYFVAGNELSSLFFILSTYMLVRTIIINGFNYKFLLYSILTIMVSTLIGTKTSLFISIFSVWFIFSLYLLSQSYLISLSLINIMMLLIITTAILYFNISSFFELMLERITYSYSNFGLLGVLFNGRELFIEDFFNKIIYSNSFSSILFGLGAVNPSTGEQFKMVEMDFFDIFMYFGLPYALLILFLHLVLIYKSYYQTKDFFCKYAILFVNSFLLLISLFVGHVWYSAMIGISWASLNLFIIKIEGRNCL